MRRFTLAIMPDKADLDSPQDLARIDGRQSGGGKEAVAAGMESGRRDSLKRGTHNRDGRKYDHHVEGRWAALLRHRQCVVDDGASSWGRSGQLARETLRLKPQVPAHRHAALRVRRCGARCGAAGVLPVPGGRHDSQFGGLSVSPTTRPNRCNVEIRALHGRM